MPTKKTIGIAIICFAVTLAIALIALLVVGDKPMEAREGPLAFLSKDMPYNHHLAGDHLFKYILFSGLAIVIMIIVKDSKKLYQLLSYPILIGSILAIIAGAIFPETQQVTAYKVNEFNIIVFSVIFGLGVFISLISIGVNLLKK